MSLTIRPLTPAERKYTYAQSRQLIGQTGSIGHLRADFGDGEQFYSSWWPALEEQNTPEFKAELNQVINALRSDPDCYGILASRSRMAAYCRKHPESRYGPDSSDYGVRADTEQYAYLLRLNPNRGEYNLYAYCYIRAHLDSHLKDAEQGIRFITPKRSLNGAVSIPALVVAPTSVNFGRSSRIDLAFAPFPIIISMA